MKVQFSVLTPSSSNLIHFGTQATFEDVISWVYQDWRFWSASSSFHQWADELNEDDNFEGTFTPDMAVDNLCSNYFFFANNKQIDNTKIYEYIIDKFNIKH